LKSWFLAGHFLGMRKKAQATAYMVLVSLSKVHGDIKISEIVNGDSQGNKYN